MSAGNYTWKIPQGTYQRRTFTYLSSVGGASVDLTGFSARMDIRPYKESSVVLVSVDTEGGGIVLGGEAGTVRVVLLTAETSLITSDGYYVIDLIDEDGEVDRFLEGAIKWSPDGTQ